MLSEEVPAPAVDQNIRTPGGERRGEMRGRDREDRNDVLLFWSLILGVGINFHQRDISDHRDLDRGTGENGFFEGGHCTGVSTDCKWRFHVQPYTRKILCAGRGEKSEER